MKFFIRGTEVNEEEYEAAHPMYTTFKSRLQRTWDKKALWKLANIYKSIIGIV